MPEVVGRRVVGNEEVDQAVLVDITGDDSQAATIPIDDAGFDSHVREAAPVVAEEVVRQGSERARCAVVELLAGLHALALGGNGPARAEGRMLGVPNQVMADVEVEVAVVVEIGERGRGGPIAVAPQAGAIGDVLEGPVSSIAILGATRTNHCRAAPNWSASISRLTGARPDSNRRAETIGQAIQPAIPRSVARQMIQSQRRLIALSPLARPTSTQVAGASSRSTSGSCDPSLARLSTGLLSVVSCPSRLFFR